MRLVSVCGLSAEEMMAGLPDNKKIIKNQFNKQAVRFSNWSPTRDQAYMAELFKYMALSAKDELLAVACGSGEFPLFCAASIHKAHGLDISAGMIELAKSQAKALQLENVFFDLHDVEHLPYENNFFSVVICKSAFHHMQNYSQVFREMMRCCQLKGRLFINDIISYDNDHVSDFFDALDRAIDVSHHARLSSESIAALFIKNKAKILKAQVDEFEFEMSHYISHAEQSRESKPKIDEIIAYGLNDPQISKFLYKKNGKLVFINRAYRILGQKVWIDYY